MSDVISGYEAIDAAKLGLAEKHIAQTLWNVRIFLASQPALASKPVEQWTIDDVIRAVKPKE